jgi:ribosome hibernation promoting factor
MVSIKFTGDSTESLRDYAAEKINQLAKKFATNITDIHVIFRVDKHRHLAEVNIQLPHSKPINAKSESEDMYKTIDLLISKLSRQLSKHKEKTREHG